MDGYYTLEKKHFIYFVNCCKAWIKFLGIFDWEVRYFFQEGDEADPKACVGVESVGNRLAAVFLFDLWDNPPNPRNIWSVAFHEVLELFFSDVRLMAEARDFNEEKYDREHHRLIRMMENSVFSAMWTHNDELFDFQSTSEVPDYEGHELFEVHRNKTLPGVEVRDNQ